MEDEVLNVEPTIVEQPVPSGGQVSGQVDTAVNSSEPTIVEQTPAVVEQPTPMDNNVTYDNIPKQDVVIDPSKDYTQNLISNAVRIERDNNIINQSGTHISNFLDNEYDYDKNEAGSYWVAGAINDVNTQMGFLNSIIYEEMYDEMDLQKYYYDTTMATARAYAAQKNKETAYGYYRAAQEKAIAEAQLTGWYMPAEGQYMLMEYETAQQKLKDPDATPEDIAKANRVVGVTEKWFGANKISTRGMKCLSMMNYEENVRHNTIMGELQKEANKIAASGAAASAASANLQLREFKFQLEEYELQSGHNITKQIGLDNKDFIGHDVTDSEFAGKYTALSGFGKGTSYNELATTKGNKLTINTDRLSKIGLSNDDIKDLKEGTHTIKGKTIVVDKNGTIYNVTDINALANTLYHSPSSYTAILNASSKEFVDSVFSANGLDGREMYTKYSNDQTTASFKTDISENGEITSKSSGFATTNKKTSDGNEIVTTVVNNEIVAGYFKDGVWTPITDKNYKTSDGKSLNEIIKNKYGKDMNTQGVNAVTIDGQTYGFGRQPVGGSTSNYITLVKDLGYKKIWNSNLGVGNKNVSSKEKITEKIKASQTGDGTLDKDGNLVKNLEYMPDYVDTESENEYTIFKAEDGDNTKWYALEDDGDLRQLNSTPKKIARISEGGLKVGDKIEKSNDVFSGDNTRESIGKLSYSVVYDKDKNESIMAYAHSDGSVEYYKVKGDPSKNEMGTYKVLAINLSEDDVRKAGGKVISDLTSKQKSVSIDYNTATKDSTEKHETIELTSPVSNNATTSKGYDAATSDVDYATYSEYVAAHKDEPDFKFLSKDEWEEKKSINNIIGKE